LLRARRKTRDFRLPTTTTITRSSSAVFWDSRPAAAVEVLGISWCVEPFRPRGGQGNPLAFRGLSPLMRFPPPTTAGRAEVATDLDPRRDTHHPRRSGSVQFSGTIKNSRRNATSPRTSSCTLTTVATTATTPAVRGPGVPNAVVIGQVEGDNPCPAYWTAPRRSSATPSRRPATRTRTLPPDSRRGTCLPSRPPGGQFRFV